MSTKSHELTEKFLASTKAYEQLRRRAVTSLLGEAATSSAILATDDERETAFHTMSDAELATFNASQIEASDHNNTIIEANLAFDQKANSIFGTIDRFAPAYVETGRFELWRRDGNESQTLAIALNSNMEADVTKRIYHIDTYDVTLNNSVPAEVSPADLMIVEKSLTQLQVTIDRMANSL